MIEVMMGVDEVADRLLRDQPMGSMGRKLRAPLNDEEYAAARPSTS
jgi:hypothetical protein